MMMDGFIRRFTGVGLCTALLIALILLFSTAAPSAGQQTSNNRTNYDNSEGSGLSSPALDATDINKNNSSSIAALFKDAGDDYRQSRYDDSAAKYLMIYRSGINNHIVFYNLGNCYYRLNKPGLAMLMWEKGLKLAPNHPLLKANVAFASGRLYDKFEAEDQHFLGAVLQAIAGIFNADGWTLMTIILFWLSGAALAFVQLTKRSVIKRISSYFTALFILLFLVSGIITAAGYYSLKYDKQGILLSPAVQVRSGPGTNNPILFVLHEATKVRIEGEQPGWLHISVPNGYNGWLPSQTVGII
jgi:tetratricopeptide (TPR) repeat protein